MYLFQPQHQMPHAQLQQLPPLHVWLQNVMRPPGPIPLGQSLHQTPGVTHHPTLSQPSPTTHGHTYHPSLDHQRQPPLDPGHTGHAYSPGQVQSVTSLSRPTATESDHKNIQLVIENPDEKERTPIKDTASGKYKCDQCTMACSNRASLQRHMKIHLETPEFSCSVCGQSYYERWRLVRHQRNKSHSSDLSSSLVMAEDVTSPEREVLVPTETKSPGGVTCKPSYSSDNHPDQQVSASNTYCDAEGRALMPVPVAVFPPVMWNQPYGPPGIKTESSTYRHHPTPRSAADIGQVLLVQDKQEIQVVSQGHERGDQRENTSPTSTSSMNTGGHIP